MPDAEVRKFQSLVKAINPRLSAPILKRLGGFCRGLDASLEEIRVSGVTRSRKMISGKILNSVHIQVDIDSPEVVPQKL